MNFTVKVVDVAGSAIAHAVVVVGNQQLQTNEQGIANVGPLSGTAFTFLVSQPNYLGEDVLVIVSSFGSCVWDNPVCTVTTQSDTVTVLIRLSRIEVAATFPISNTDLAARRAFNPEAVFEWIDDGGNRTGRYLGMSNDVVETVPVQHPLLPDKPSEGWGRLRHEPPAPVDPSRDGNLYWLEWGVDSVGNKRIPCLLVAVWAPRLREPVPSKLDFVVFYSPNTSMKDYPEAHFPWREGAYPYMALKNPSSLLVQPYPGLGHRYLFPEVCLIYQLMAASRQAIVIFPIQPYGAWGAFAYAAGLARLLAEIIHFLQRIGHIGPLVGNNGQQDQAPQPGFRRTRLASHLQPPGLGTIALSGFSSGVAPIVSMLGSTPGKFMNTALFGKGNELSLEQVQLFVADSSDFLRTWNEVWDHDGAFLFGEQPSLKDRPSNFEQAAISWLNSDNKHILRCYHSSYTTTWDITSGSVLTRYASSPRKSASAGAALAAEVHADARLSLVYFSDGYLNHDPKSELLHPSFWSAGLHKSVPLVTFGHAATTSGLRKATYNSSAQKK